MRRFTLLLGITLMVAGCGLMNVPMVIRLDEDNQKVMDHYWQHMLTPADQTDREVLLGAITIFQMYQAGVDRADYHAEKMVGEKRVSMDVHFQRDKPDDDGFYITIFGPYGQVLRAERYSRQDVEALTRKLGESFPTTQPLASEQEARKTEKERLELAIQTALGVTPDTQPTSRP